MAAPAAQPVALTAGQLVATLGAYALYHVNGDHYRLYAPDNGYSQAWLRHHLPAGDWFTLWSGFGDSLTVDITR